MHIEKLTPQIGAVIREINLNEKTTDTLIEKIKEAFYNHLVIFIEDQDIDVQCENCSFFVLRIPLGYGYMTSTYYG